MLIAVNTKLLLKNRLEGMGWFGYETLKRITQNHPEHKFLFIFDRPWDESFIFSDNIIPVKTFLPSRHAILWYLRFEHVIPRIVKKHKADLFLSTDSWSTLCQDFKTYDVIHDIDPIHRPKNLPFFTRKYYNYYYPKFAKQNTRIGTVSEYSKQDIVKTLEIDPNKIDVIYNGSNSVYTPFAEAKKEVVRKELTDGHPYFVYIGSINPRKNIESMLQAFEAFKISTKQPHKMVIVGERMWNYPALDQIVDNMQHKNDLIFTGRLTPERLHEVLGSALSLVLVSHLEGFGIPLIEAMNCDVPVICSNTTALPEVAGEAGLLVDPNSIQSIAKGMIKMSSDHEFRNNLIEKGKIQRQKFSWDQSAENLWNGMMRCF